METDYDFFKKLLVDPGYITASDFERAFTQARESATDPREVFVGHGLITENQLGQLLANEYGVPFVDLAHEDIDNKVLELVPAAIAERGAFALYQKDINGVRMAMSHPDNIELRHIIEKRIGLPVQIYFTTETSLRDAFARYKIGLRKETHQALQKLANPNIDQEERDSLIIHIVEALLEYGYESKASDIHIEPYDKKMLIRFRVDGVMHDVADLPTYLADLITTRIKILAHMRTDEHRAAQDGKFRFFVHSLINEEIAIDVRVSVLPVVHGENVVMRLLSSENKYLSLKSLGLEKADLDKVERAATAPHGMLLVTGPTGSGKTTTLYAVMTLLNTREVHIATIEDPVEYNIPGVSQTQVNKQTELTFAKGLRALVRQDPDIIMVGEIRDEETADIAINSAMTGHLVLSTLHTNDAATTVPRLIDMNVEPFLIASTINVIIAQRLVRTICIKCRYSYSPTAEEIATLSSDVLFKKIYDKKGYKDFSKLTFFRGKGCDACMQTGYEGRSGIFEVMEISDDIRALIKNRETSDRIADCAEGLGMTPMLEDGMRKVLLGVTTLDEVLRVIYEASS